MKRPDHAVRIDRPESDEPNRSDPLYSRDGPQSTPDLFCRMLTRQLERKGRRGLENKRECGGENQSGDHERCDGVKDGVRGVVDQDGRNNDANATQSVLRRKESGIMHTFSQ